MSRDLQTGAGLVSECLRRPCVMPAIVQHVRLETASLVSILSHPDERGSVGGDCDFHASAQQRWDGQHCGLLTGSAQN